MLLADGEFVKAFCKEGITVDDAYLKKIPKCWNTWFQLSERLLFMSKNQSWYYQANEDELFQFGNISDISLDKARKLSELFTTMLTGYDEEDLELWAGEANALFYEFSQLEEDPQEHLDTLKLFSDKIQAILQE